MSRVRYSFIDALRGFAAIGVLFSHLAGDFSVISKNLPQFISYGALGVPVFFVISGFAIAASNDGVRFSGSYVGRFALRRSLRLDPPYWACLFAVILLIEPASFSRLLANMFYVHNLLGFKTLLNVSWSLCIEVQLYLFFVLGSWLCQSIGRRTGKSTEFWQFALFGASAVASLWLVSITRNRETYFGPWWFMFYAGVLSYWTVISRIHEAIPLVYVAAIYLLLRPTNWHDDTLVMVLQVAALVIWRNRIATLLGQAVFQFFGKISYSLYLFHMPVIWLLGKAMAGGLLFAAVAAVLSIGVAWGAYLLIEKPSIGWSKKVRNMGRDTEESTPQASMSTTKSITAENAV